MNEEQRIQRFPGWDAKTHGAYFTPEPLVARVLHRARAHAGPGPRTLIDPSCGAGAFLVQAAPDEQVFGLELSPEVASHARARVPRAEILTGDALRGGFESLTARLPHGGTELWVGNPPYNGTSALLKDAKAYARLRDLLRADLLPGTSLRDDFVFFLLLAARRLKERRGVLAFITPSTLLDGYLYAPVRKALLEDLRLAEVIDLGPGVFAKTRVRTCLTVWKSCPAPPGHILFERAGQTDALTPESPDWALTPIPSEAAALDAEWRAKGELLTTLVPVSFPGLKTRFDSLLVDDDPERLFARVQDFAATPPGGLTAFARRHAIAGTQLAKLRALKQGPELQPHRDALRPFYRYAGERHRGTVPESARAWCYLDRRLIPRGDHRLHGAYDPHRGAVKLLFNIRERPLSAALLQSEGCVHAHRHARFAPLLVPQRVRDEGLGITATETDLGSLVPNLSAHGLAWAQENGGPLETWRAIVAFINSEQVQTRWSPALGARRILSIPLSSLGQGFTSSTDSGSHHRR